MSVSDSICVPERALFAMSALLSERICSETSAVISVALKLTFERVVTVNL